MSVIIITIYLVFLCAIKSGATATSEISETVQSDEFKYYPKIGYVHHHPIPAQWTEARTRCYYEGAELMSPVNKDMLEVMLDIGKTDPMWTGVHATYSKLDYFSITGVPLSKMPITWSLGEPNNKNNNEECLLMLPGGKMADCSCNETYAFACYKSNNFETSQCGSTSGYKIDHLTNSCYKFHSIAQNWNKAFMICAAEGAHLAVIDNPNEPQVLQDLFSKYSGNVIRGGPRHRDLVWLGYRDWENGMLWMTINGMNIENLVSKGIIAWANGEPENNGSYESCGSMSRRGTLYDMPCDFKMPFICEFENRRPRRIRG